MDRSDLARAAFRRASTVFALGLFLAWAFGAPVLARPGSEQQDSNVCETIGTSGLIPDGTVWTAAESPYIVTCDLRVADEASSLTIESGVEVRFAEGRRMRVEGPLSINGAEAGDVVFTSVQTTPSPGDWYGVELNAGETLHPVTLSGLRIAYAGGGSAGKALSINRAGVALDHFAIEKSGGRGVMIDRVGDIALSDFSVVDSTAGPGIELREVSDAVNKITLVNGRIENNREEAILSGANIEIEASGSVVSGNAVNAIVLTGSRIAGDLTWHGGDLPIVVDSSLNVDAALTVEPNTVVKFRSDRRQIIVGRGSIGAVGSAESPIYFSSLSDDEACSGGQVDCDTNNDDGATSPSAGEWIGIEIRENAGASSFEHVVMRYGGAGTSAPMLNVEAPGLVLRDSSLSFSAQDAMGIDNAPATIERVHYFDNKGNALAVSTAGSTNVTVHESRFERNGGAAIHIEPDVQLDLADNAVAGAGMDAYSNAFNGVAIETGDISRPITWQAGDLPWLVIPRSLIDVDTGGKLTVEPGAVVKLGEAVRLTVGRGRLELGGASGPRSLVTALTDDACDASGGTEVCDSNGDGAITTPRPGVWQYLRVEQQSQGATIENALIRYGGARGSSQSMLQMEHDKDRLASTEIAFSETNGIACDEANAFYIVGNDIHDNLLAGLKLGAVANGMTVYLEGNRIHDNQGAAIDMDANVRLELDDPDNPAAPEPNSLERNRINGAAVSGDATISRVWKASTIPFIVTGDLEVSQQSVLTIEAGTVIKLDGGKLTSTRGAIVAQGSAEAPVIFTSVNDRSVGTNAKPLDGDIDPRPGDWEGIELNCLSRSTCSRFEHVEVRFAGGRDQNVPALTIQNEAVEVAFARIADGAGPGLLFDNTGGLLENSTIEGMYSDAIVIEATQPIQPRIREMNVTGNRGAVIRMDANAEPIVEGMAFDDNAINGAAVEGGVSVRRLWKRSALPYVLVGGGVFVGANAAIEVEAGTVIKAEQGAGIDIRRGGTFNAPLRGSGDAPVVITSLRDDASCSEAGAAAESAVCDTNNDDDALTALPGDWNGIDYQPSANGMSLQGVEVRYAGRSGDAITVREGRSEIKDSLIADSSGNGIRVAAASAIIEGNTIRNNAKDGLRLESNWTGSSSIRGNRFTGNDRSVDYAGSGEALFSANVAIGNTHDAMLYCSPVQTNQIWQNDLMREIDCSLKVAARLQLEQGTVLQMSSQSGIDVDGELVADGVVFTGAGAAPEPGDWGGITFGGTSRGGRIRHSLLMYGGRSSTGVVDIKSVNPVDILYNLFLRTASTGVSASAAQDDRTVVAGNILQEIGGSRAAALRVSGASKLRFERNRVNRVEIGVTSSGDGQPKLHQNSFENTPVFGVENKDADFCIDATGNWWGDGTGPRDESDSSRDKCGAGKVNRGAKGVPVSDHVDYGDFIADGAPPVSPQLDTLFCGVTNQSRMDFRGATSPNARVAFFDNDGAAPILTVDANDQGSFVADLSLADGEHAISVEASLERKAGAATVVLASPRSSYRHITVDSSQPVDPAGIRFIYGPSSEPRVQPLRGVTGCATGCGGPTSGRVTLPAGAQVKVRVPVDSGATRVVFSQPGQPEHEMTSRIDYWETESFEPVEGNFRISVDGRDTSECFGFIFLGNAGRVYLDTGIGGDPDFQFDFENNDISEWIRTGSAWGLTDVNAHESRYSLTDSPAGNYGPGVDQSVAYVRSFNMLSIASPELTFWHTYRFASGDSGSVEVSTNNTSWTSIARFNSTRGDWVAEKVSLEAYAKEPILHLRFRFRSDGNPTTVDDGWYIDDIAIGPGGADNGRYDTGEPLVEDARVTLLQRNPDTGAWREWEGGPTGQTNPQTTDGSGTYGFYNLPPGEYRVMVDSQDLGVVASDILPVWDGTLSIDIPVVGREPIFFPITYKARP